ncbi:M14 family zinc carboxypeptidase [Amycolatopsis anabasis]|uniref:M14 family zinc carboxypeptidase n=1 Tax=Amycolatopsis anabasis TaxID=1840409 RepID=UPI00131B9892|nr:M14 family zinc carboxypeptidase [Amycolatopsis anabasis]
MSVQRRRNALTTALAAAVAGVLLLLPQAGPQPSAIAADPPLTRAGETLFVYRVAGAAGEAERLFAAGFDVLEQRQGADLFVLGDRAASGRLSGAGFPATVDKVLPAPPWNPPARRDNSVRLPGDLDETYYGGYHTVNAQYAHLDQVAADHPDLAEVVTYGQSWRKSKGQPNGYDLKAICLTKKNAGDCARSTGAPKPRFFLMGQIHAREITTGDVAWRWIDYLAGNYGKDDAVTKLMDTTELWVVPIANPDGVDVVQQGGDNPVPQRKNVDSANGNCGVPNTGVDLNRNAGSHWGASGISHQPCSAVYLGPSPDSEVENVALERLFTSLYPDRRGSGDGTAAPADTKGLFITLHSYASAVIFPWNFSHTTHTGNDAALRSLGGQLGGILGYPAGQAGEVLYDAAGGTDDWVYDQLGVASYTIEVGDNQGRGCDGFLPRYSCQGDYFWPKMRPALLLAAQRAAAPYQGG